VRFNERLVLLAVLWSR